MKRKWYSATAASSIAALSLLVGAGGPAQAANLVLVDAFKSPVPSPAFDLTFDAQTGTLWGCDNSASHAVWNFDLHGTLLSSWTVSPNTYNLNSIAVDSAGQHVFYWNNLTRTLTEASLSGRTVSTTVLPWGYQNGVDNIEYEPSSGQLVLTYRKPFADSPGFLHVSPASHAIVSEEPFDFSTVGLSYVNGFCLTDSDYWLLGPDFGQNVDRLVRVSRSSLQMVESYNIPASTAYKTLGVTIDPATERFYMNDWTTGNVDVFEVVPEPSTWSLAVAGILALIGTARLRLLASKRLGEAQGRQECSSSKSRTL